MNGYGTGVTKNVPDEIANALKAYYGYSSVTVLNRSVNANKASNFMPAVMATAPAGSTGDLPAAATAFAAAGVQIVLFQLGVNEDNNTPSTPQQYAKNCATIAAYLFWNVPTLRCFVHEHWPYNGGWSAAAARRAEQRWQLATRNADGRRYVIGDTRNWLMTQLGVASNALTIDGLHWNDTAAVLAACNSAAAIAAADRQSLYADPMTTRNQLLYYPDAPVLTDSAGQVWAANGSQGLGAGSFPATVTILDTDDEPVAGASVVVTSDAAGRVPVAGPVLSDADGTVAGLKLPAPPWYVWASHPLREIANPTVVQPT
jgi:hypothetical protein